MVPNLNYSQSPEGKVNPIVTPGLDQRALHLNRDKACTQHELRTAAAYSSHHLPSASGAMGG
jgi:hypothetical protein